jgi:integrase
MSCPSWAGCGFRRSRELRSKISLTGCWPQALLRARFETRVLPAGDRAIWATALYAGLRLGELKALRWHDIDFDAGLIHVTRGWDRHAGPITPKSRSGTRRIPLGQPLRGYLAAHRLAQQPRSELAFGHPNGRPFTQAVTNRARTAWTTRGLTPIGLHECRHTYASYMIAAGINPKALSSFMGHSSITTTLDRFGHLMPGNETHAANMLNTYLTAEL